MNRETATAQRTKRLAAALFMSFFSAQAAFIVLAPTLPDVAREFGVSIGTAGQLRTAASIAGVAAGVALTPLAARLGTRRVLVSSLVAVSAGAGASAVAPTIALLAIAQLVVGGGVAGVVAAGIAAATEWPDPERRGTVLAWTTVGQPAAWVAGLPVVGLLSGLGWRWSWLIVPAAAASALTLLPAHERHIRTASAPGRLSLAVLREPAVARWSAGEVMAYAGWGGTLVYVGALLSDSYGLGTSTVAILLAGAAVAYFPGTFAVRRRLTGDLGLLLATLAAGLAFGSLVLGAVRPSAAASTALFAAVAVLAGARGIAGSAFGINAAPEQKLAIGSIRAAATQLGYLMGAGLGGVAVEVGGFSALGVTLALFFTAAALPHALAEAGRRSLRGAARAAEQPCV